MSLLLIIEFKVNIDKNATSLLLFLIIKKYIFKLRVEPPIL